MSVFEKYEEISEEDHIKFKVIAEYVSTLQR